MINIKIHIDQQIADIKHQKLKEFKYTNHFKENNNVTSSNENSGMINVYKNNTDQLLEEIKYLYQIFNIKNLTKLISI